ncbi:hypothetical protein [Saccharothrix syringae]|uniref:Uncharacterized protein n=1 Tax=Saccharothrix syringae TaxID=103733 RepID=A0A5Q0H6I2_SACSY|nr:hypothetical protein [Saccharothrix syringae]QFZ21460.1 hypothetical protein EKG83_32365 [Saccharothrix syringae]
MGTTREDRDQRVLRVILAALLLTGATNAVVAVTDAVTWAWWAAGLCLLGALPVAAAVPEAEEPELGARVPTGGAGRR